MIAPIASSRNTAGTMISVLCGLVLMRMLAIVNDWLSMGCYSGFGSGTIKSVRYEDCASMSMIRSPLGLREASALVCCQSSRST